MLIHTYRIRYAWIEVVCYTLSLQSNFTSLIGPKPQTFRRPPLILSTLAQVVWAVLELTARNLDGHGVRAIIVGEKGGGDAEGDLSSHSFPILFDF